MDAGLRPPLADDGVVSRDAWWGGVAAFRRPCVVMTRCLYVLLLVEWGRNVRTGRAMVRLAGAFCACAARVFGA